MNDPAHDSWYRALTLRERIENGLPPTSTVNLQYGYKKVALWRSQKPFGDQAFYLSALAQLNIHQEAFAALLGERVEDLAKRIDSLPGDLEAARTLIENAGSTVVTDLIPDQVKSHPGSGFLVIFMPYLQKGKQRLDAGLAKLANIDAASVGDRVIAGICAALIQMVSRTMVLELHVAKLQGQLQGGTPEDRYQSFIHGLAKPDRARDFLREYPVLARLAYNLVNQRIETILEAITHLEQDRTKLEQEFGLAHDDLLTDPGGSAGDLHRGGRSVRIMTFSSGAKLVYKPRSLAMDQSFAHLLQWLKEREPQIDLIAIPVIDRGSHGWMAHVTPQSCRNEEQIGRFYQRIGIYLALFHALDGVDLHFENLIAAGEYPVPVDLETLFHARFPHPIPVEPDYAIVSRYLQHSVLSVGLLPFRLGEDDDQAGIDISGLASMDGQTAPDPIVAVHQPQTDKMRITRKRAAMPGGHNQPILEGQQVNLLDWVDDIVTGFTHGYQVLERHQHELTAEDGPLHAFAHVENRAVLRPTRVYGLLLSESFHPDLLRDARDRALHFHRLWIGAAENPALKQVTRAEIDELEQGDIPSFYGCPTNRGLVSGTGFEYEAAFSQSAMDATREKIANLDEADRRQQEWLIRATLGTLALSRDNLSWPSYTTREPDSEVSWSETKIKLVDAARGIGDQLAEQAMVEGSNATWVGLAYTNSRWSVVPLMEDLYGGLPGLALFLSHLGVITGETTYTTLAGKALGMTETRLKTTKNQIMALGAFQGWGGIIYTLSHLGVLREEPPLIERALEYLDPIQRYLSSDHLLDIIGGAAGCIHGLIALHEVSDESQALQLAIQCGDHLRVKAERQPKGLAWRTSVGDGNPLTGFSHGAAGIAHALLALAEHTGEDRFQKTALDALLFEEHRFQTANSVPREEYREGENQTLSTAWCYGAAGAVLAEQRASRLRPETKASIQQRLEALSEQGFGSNHCLCHGDLGNLEPFIQAVDQGFTSWQPRLELLTRTVLDSIQNHGPLCGTPLGVRSPGLMNGLAGIGYGLLRLAHPHRIPSVLTLEPPKQGR